MRTSLIRWTSALALALSLVLAAPLNAQAEDAREPILLSREHVALEHTEYEYTGSPIRPNVTVRVEDTLLTLDQHYHLDFTDNVEAGQGKVTVTGIATAGYQGQVEIPFTIVPKTTEPPETTLPAAVALTREHIHLDKSEYPYAGKAVEPEITVTVDGKTLTAGTDYKLRFEDNDKPGTAYVIVTAADDSGYSGAVRVAFTIREAEKTPAYTLTPGADGKWYQKSGKTLAFTVGGKTGKFLSVSVDGKRISDSVYTLGKDGTVITLKTACLNTLKQGEHTLTVHFEDGTAQADFRVLAAKDVTNPATGDGIHLWVWLLFVSLTGLAGCGYAWRRRAGK